MITDNEARKAANTLIRYCKEHEHCVGCAIAMFCEDSCDLPFSGCDLLPDTIEASQLAKAMAAAIMNRKD